MIVRVNSETNTLTILNYQLKSRAE